MTTSNDYKKYAVLYVDDEEQSLKYFPKLFGHDLRCLTASSVAEARRIIAREGDGIGVVISDQRMPGESGVELLTWLRANHPQVVRILTTAYTDLDSAIASVNSGAIFRYVVKPWEHREMYGVLARAMEFHLVTRERDALLREKLTALQNLVVMDRLRGFAVLAASLSNRLRNPLPALKSFLDQAPAAESTNVPGNSSDLWELAQRESRRLVALSESVAHRTLESHAEYTPRQSLSTLLEPALADAKTAVPGARLEIAADAPAIGADGDMVQRLVRTMVALVRRADPDSKSLLISAQAATAAGGRPAARISVTAGPDAWNATQLASLYTALSAGQLDGKRDADLLSAYFMAHHHGGTVAVHPAPPAGPGLAAILPTEPAAVAESPAPQEWIEEILTFQREL